MANPFVLTSCHEKHQSTRFFDKHFLLEKLTKLKDPLVKLNNHIDWKIFTPILDASIIEASLLCNTSEENKQIKQGQTPESWQKPTKQTATERPRCSVGQEEQHELLHGYRNHIKVDQGTRLINSYVVSDAATHDSQGLDPDW